MGIPWGDGVISRGGKPNQGGEERGKKGKERSHKIIMIVKRDGSKRLRKRKKGRFCFYFERTVSE